MNIPELEGWTTATDAGLLLKLSRQSINKLVRAGRFEGARKLGKQYVLPTDVVENMRKTREESGDAEAGDEELLEG